MSNPLDPGGLVAACDDARLLAFPLWPRQRGLLASVEQTRLNVWALGRRSGKTSCAALTLTWDAALRPHLRKYVRPGERRYCVGVATNLRQARLLIDAARTIVKTSPLLASMLQDETDDELVFPDASVVAFPATARGVRGWAVSSLVFDEMAHMLDTDGNQAAEPLWRALVPATAQFGSDARIVACSTPWGTEGLFAELFEKAEAGEIDDAIAMQATTAEANPTVDADFLRREFERDPDAFAGEYEAEFVGSGGAFFDADRVNAAVADRGDLDRLEIVDAVIGVDLAFNRDLSVAIVGGRDPADPTKLRVACVRTWEPSPAASFEERRAVEDGRLEEIVALARYYGNPDTNEACPVVGDTHLAAPVAEFFAARGVWYTALSLSGDKRDDAYMDLRSMIYDGHLELPNHSDLIRELGQVKTRYRAGKSRIVL